MSLCVLKHEHNVTQRMKVKGARNCLGVPCTAIEVSCELLAQ